MTFFFFVFVGAIMSVGFAVVPLMMMNVPRSVVDLSRQGRG